MWPRQLLGYGRLENPLLVGPITALYKEAWGPLQNFFLPSMKLKKKYRRNSRMIRRHYPAQTAYQRLLQSGHLTDQEERRLQDWFESLDPFDLAEEVERRLERILRPKIQSGELLPTSQLTE